MRYLFLRDPISKRHGNESHEAFCQPQRGAHRSSAYCGFIAGQGQPLLKHAPVSGRSGDKDQPDRIAVFVGIWPCHTRDSHGNVGRTSLNATHRHGLSYLGAHRSILGDHLEWYANGKGFAFLGVSDEATVEDLSRALSLGESAGKRSRRTIQP